MGAFVKVVAFRQRKACAHRSSICVKLQSSQSVNRLCLGVAARCRPTTCKVSSFFRFLFALLLGPLDLKRKYRSVRD